MRWWQCRITNIRGLDKNEIRAEYETGNYTFKKPDEKFNISEGTIKL
ncbi:hypothetical protein [Clostridium thermopalmarium]|nr:hypothetical protein [Clostridium thermopalmarium]